jgi:hypothetical protein
LSLSKRVSITDGGLLCFWVPDILPGEERAKNWTEMSKKTITSLEDKKPLFNTMYIRGVYRTAHRDLNSIGKKRTENQQVCFEFWYLESPPIRNRLKYAYTLTHKIKMNNA